MDTELPNSSSTATDKQNREQKLDAGSLFVLKSRGNYVNNSSAAYVLFSQNSVAYVKYASTESYLSHS